LRRKRIWSRTPARLAIIDDQNNVPAAGADVAREAEALAVNSCRNFLKAQGHLVVMSVPLTAASAKSNHVPVAT